MARGFPGRARRAALAAAAGALAWLAGAAPASAARDDYSSEDLSRAAEYVSRHPDFGSRFRKCWEDLIYGLASTREHRAYLAGKKRIPLIIADTGSNWLNAETGAYYYDGSVFVNRTYLALCALELERRGVAPALVPEYLAWKMMPFLAHEIRHGMVEDELRSRFGFSCASMLLENEVVALFDDVRVMREIVKKRPELWEEALLIDIDREEGLRLAYWGDGFGEFLAHAGALYSGKVPLMKLRQEELLKSLDQDLAEARQYLADIAAAKKVLAGSSDPLRRAQARSLLDQPPSEGEARSLLKDFGLCREGLQAARTYRDYRAFYRAKLDAIRRECDADRAEKKL